MDAVFNSLGQMPWYGWVGLVTVVVAGVVAIYKAQSRGGGR